VDEGWETEGEGAAEDPQEEEEEENGDHDDATGSGDNKRKAVAARDVVLTAPWTALLSATALGAVPGAARSAPTAGLSDIPWHKTCILASRRVIVGPARKRADELWQREPEVL
jgi:hypothetical protein